MAADLGVCQFNTDLQTKSGHILKMYQCVYPPLLSTVLSEDVAITEIRQIYAICSLPGFLMLSHYGQGVTSSEGQDSDTGLTYQ